MTTGALTPTVPPVGAIVCGKYRIDGILGSGGMGVVLRAHHLGLDERVAIKFPSSPARDPRIIDRFLREGRAAAKIQSQYVARMMDVGTTEAGQPFLVMEYLEGIDLAVLLRQRRRLDVPLTVEIVLQACEALAEAHSLGIVHRDLKPSNIFMTRRCDQSSSIKVLDFGCSKLMFEDAPGLTTNGVVGTPHYMSPEHMIASSRDIDARADIWSLGVIMHELITGQRPFRASTVPQVFVNVLEHPAVPLRADWPDASPALEAIILRCLVKDRVGRYSDLGEFACAIVDAGFEEARPSADRIRRILSKPRHRERQELAQAAIAGGPTETLPADSAAAAPETTTFWEHPETATPRRPNPLAKLVPILGVAAMITVVTAWLVVTRPGSPHSSSPSSGGGVAIGQLVLPTTSSVFPAPSERAAAPPTLSSSSAPAKASGNDAGPPVPHARLRYSPPRLGSFSAASGAPRPSATAPAPTQSFEDERR